MIGDPYDYASDEEVRPEWRGKQRMSYSSAKRPRNIATNDEGSARSVDNNASGDNNNNAVPWRGASTPTSNGNSSFHGGLQNVSNIGPDEGDNSISSEDSRVSRREFNESFYDDDYDGEPEADGEELDIRNRAQPVVAQHQRREEEANDGEMRLQSPNHAQHVPQQETRDARNARLEADMGITEHAGPEALYSVVDGEVSQVWLN